MEKKQSLSPIKKKKTKTKDPCPVCGKDLYHNNLFSKRVGLFDYMSVAHHIIGWACPYCNTEFDRKDNIMYIYGQDYTQGSA